MRDIMRDSLKKIVIKFPYLYIALKKKNIKKIFITIKGYKTLKNNYLFNEEFYIQNSENLGFFKTNPLLHYILFGYKKNYNPSLNFDTEYYLKKYKNVKKEDMNPLLHYSLYGKNECKYPNLDEEKRAKNSEFNEKIRKSSYITNSKLKMYHIEAEKDFQSEYLKIGIFTDTSLKNPTASYCIRIFYILNKISKNKKYKFFVYFNDDKFKEENKLKESFFNYKCFDVVIIQRTGIREDILKIILDNCEKYDIKIVHEFDDDFLAIPKTHPTYQHFLGKHNILKLIAKKADIFVVSTDELKNRYLKYSNNIEVVKNYSSPPILNYNDNLDYKKIMNTKNFTIANKSNKLADNLVKLAYFGGISHKEDFLLIKNSINNVVNKVKSKEINLELDIVGIFKKDELNEDWINIFETLKPYIPFFKYLHRFDWDVGIVPLVDDKFNAGKSELKYLEYTSIGVPSICSNVKPYNSAIKDGFNGFLAENPEEWEEKLEKLVLDENLRKAMVKNAIADINENYLVDSRVQQWEQILKNLIYLD